MDLHLNTGEVFTFEALGFSAPHPPPVFSSASGLADRGEGEKLAGADAGGDAEPTGRSGSQRVGAGSFRVRSSAVRDRSHPWGGTSEGKSIHHLDLEGEVSQTKMSRFLP